MKPSIVKNNNGVAALLSVVIIGVVALLMAKNSAMIGRADLDIVNNNIFSSIAESNAESCLEEALRQIQLDENYTNSALSIDLTQGSCIVEVVKNDRDYTLLSEGQMLVYLKSIEVQASLSGGAVMIDSWKNK